jgi:hypothetical protein
MQMQYADFYVLLCTFAVLCAKLPDLPCLIVPGSTRQLSEYVRLLGNRGWTLRFGGMFLDELFAHHALVQVPEAGDVETPIDVQDDAQ